MLRKIGPVRTFNYTKFENRYQSILGKSTRLTYYEVRPRRLWRLAITKHHVNSNPSNENLLYLTDDQLRKGIEAMFFAYRGFTADPDKILQNFEYGRAHHRAIHFIHRSPGTTVTNLLAILGVTKQSLNRVLRKLIDDGLVESHVGKRDKRERNLSLTDAGVDLEGRLSEAQRRRMRTAFRAAGPEAVAGFRQVLEEMMDRDLKRQYEKQFGNTE